MDFEAFARQTKWQRVANMVLPGSWEIVRQTADYFSPREFRDAYNYWQTPRGQYEATAIAYSIPGIGSLLQHNEAMQEMDRSLDRYGLTYDDVLKGNIRKTMGVNGAGGSVLGYVSSNIGELYK